MRKVKIIVLFLILAIPLTSPLAMWFKLFKEEPLLGFYSKSELLSMKFFTWPRWFSSEFQLKFSEGINVNTGLRNTMIRFNNQIDYSLFGVIHAEGFVMGKEGMLYEEDYIHEYTGKYFIGRTAIDKKLSRLKNVMDSLKAHDVPLLLVYDPGKASFYPEYIPGRFHPDRRAQTNYEVYVQRSRELGLSFIDLNYYFLKMKDTAKYPLFPRYGMHWSMYGVTHAMDTLIKAIESATSTQLPRYGFNLHTLAPTTHCFDNDIGELLNLMFPLDASEGAFPVPYFDTTVPRSINALIIADSYYLNIVEDYGPHLFASQEYWYYNNKLFPYQNNDPPVYVDKSDLRNKLLRHDVILLMVSEINLHCGFWNFADEAYLAFHPEVKDPLIYSIENDIRNERDWFRFTVKKSRDEGRPLEEVIRGDAGYTFFTNYENLKGKTDLDTIQYIAMTIKNSPEWLSNVEEKARKYNIDLDTMVMMDARYTYNTSKKNQ